MGYEKINGIISDNGELEETIRSIEESVMEHPYLVAETLKIISDGSVFWKYISDKNMHSLCNMVHTFMKKMYAGYAVGDKFDADIKYGKVTKYYVETANGKRDATSSEVKSCVSELYAEELYPAGEENYKLFCLSCWAFTGNRWAYKQAGYELKYSIDGNVITTTYEMIKNSANMINRMMEWYESEEFKRARRFIKEIKARGPQKYAEYAFDEIRETLTIKQVAEDIIRRFPRNSDDEGYRKALGCALKIRKDGYNKSKRSYNADPIDIAFMRRQYARYIEYRKTAGIEIEDNSVLVEMCNELEVKRYSGEIDSSHFAYKIISTIKANGYSRCSSNQYRIIKEAYEKLHVDDVEDKSTTVISDEEVSSIEEYECLSDVLDD